jgi:hypothetical protein
MKLYQTTSTSVGDDRVFTEFATSATDASKARTRLKKAYQVAIETTEVDVTTTRSELVVFLNKLTAHESWVSSAVVAKLET